MCVCVYVLCERQKFAMAVRRCRCCCGVESRWRERWKGVVPCAGSEERHFGGGALSTRRHKWKILFLKDTDTEPFSTSRFLKINVAFLCVWLIKIKLFGKLTLMAFRKDRIWHHRCFYYLIKIFLISETPLFITRN